MKLFRSKRYRKIRKIAYVPKLVAAFAAPFLSDKIVLGLLSKDKKRKKEEENNFNESTMLI